MSIKLFSTALLASTLLAAPALAQSTQPAAPAQAPAASATTPTMKAGQWRASKLMGLNVYNAANEKIGDIKDIIVDSSGKADIVVIGVGGFLGMGEHNVGLAWNQVKFMDEAPRTATRTDGGTTTTTTGTGTGTAARTAPAVRDYPDHAVVNMTKDQLKAMPAFKYASENR